MNNKIILIGFFIIQTITEVFACTSFGYITKTGTVIAKNSDYYYDKQSVEILEPNKQFDLWYNNTYNNNLKVFAQMANNNVKMGINEAGLTAMEEDPQFINLNKLSANIYANYGSEARNTRIKELLLTGNKNENDVLSWFLDTKSSGQDPHDNKWCLATSIFNSNLGKNTNIDTSKLHPDAIGTVASMFVFNNGTPQNTKVIVRLVDKITTDRKGKQTIFYKETKSMLPTLFTGNYKFTEKTFTRLAPRNGICK